MLKILLSALLADVDKNEQDGDMADKEHMKQIKRIEQKIDRRYKEERPEESVKGK